MEPKGRGNSEKMDCSARCWILQKFIYLWPEELWNSTEEQNISCINLGRYLREKWNFPISPYMCVITMGANYEHFSSRFPWPGISSETSPSSASLWNVRLRVGEQARNNEDNDQAVIFIVHDTGCPELSYEHWTPYTDTHPQHRATLTPSHLGVSSWPDQSQISIQITWPVPVWWALYMGHSQPSHYSLVVVTIEK